MNKNVKRSGRLCIAALAALVAATVPAAAQSIGTRPGAAGGLSSMQNIQIGSRSPLNQFGLVGGSYTRNYSQVFGAPDSKGLPSGPTNRGTGNAPYNFGSSYAAPGRQFSDRFARNSRMANQLFGRNATYTMLNRNPSGGFGGDLTLALSAGRSARPGIRGTTYYPGFSPASITLDRNMVLGATSELARMSIGPRDMLPRAPASATSEGAAESMGLEAVDPMEAILPDTPQGISFEERQKLKIDEDVRTSIERGDDFARQEDFHRARASYHRARIANPDAAAPYLRLSIVCLLMQDPAQSGTFLKQGVKRLATPQDLQINAEDCVPSVDTLRKIYSEFSQKAASPTAGPGEHVIAAFLACVLNDRTVAASEIRRAIEMAPARAEYVTFERLMSGEGAARP